VPRKSGLDADNIAAYPPADLTIERIGDLAQYNLSALLGTDRPERAKPEQS
jgi:hypothetical protein